MNIKPSDKTRELLLALFCSLICGSTALAAALVPLNIA